MSICPKCKNQINDDSVFCPVCGLNIKEAQQNANTAQQQQQNTAQQQPKTAPTPVTPPPYYNTQQNQYQTNDDKFKSGVNNAVDKTKDFFKNTKDETSLHDEQDIQQNKILALVSYLGYFFFIPMIVKPQSRYLRFHGNQGLIFVLCSLGLSIIHGIIISILSAISVATTFTAPFVAVICAIFMVIFSLIIYVPIVIWLIIGISNAVRGKAKELPLIGRFRILKEF
ncbi:MAG: hypothetical protein ACI4I4_01245 [Acutalibacteraceae bacterium]